MSIDLDQAGNTLHQRLMSSRTLTTAEIAEAFLPPLVKALRKQFGKSVDPQLLETVAEDALLSYFADPQKYKPERGSLIAFLHMDARGDLLNHLKKNNKVVELDHVAPEYLAEGVAFLREKLSPTTRRVLEQIKEPADREIFQQMLDGVRETQDYAVVLGIEDLPIQEQIKKLADGIYAITPLKPLQDGEFGLVQVPILAEMSTRPSFAPPIWAFGIYAEGHPLQREE